jgi:hypothetical protein
MATPAFPHLLELLEEAAKAKRSAKAAARRSR